MKMKTIMKTDIKKEVKLCIGKCNPKVVDVKKDENGRKRPVVYCDSCDRFLGRQSIHSNKINKL